MKTQSVDSEIRKIFLNIEKVKYPKINNNHDIEISAVLCLIVADTKTLIHNIYDDIHNLNTKEDLWLSGRSILAPRNDQILYLKNWVLGMILSDSTSYLSIEYVIQMEEYFT